MTYIVSVRVMTGDRLCWGHIERRTVTGHEEMHVAAGRAG